jgi:hypothetical protein
VLIVPSVAYRPSLRILHNRLHSVCHLYSRNSSPPARVMETSRVTLSWYELARIKKTHSWPIRRHSSINCLERTPYCVQCTVGPYVVQRLSSNFKGISFDRHFGVNKLFKYRVSSKDTNTFQIIQKANAVGLELHTHTSQYNKYQSFISNDPGDCSFTLLR